jgi:hypothetical protein
MAIRFYGRYDQFLIEGQQTTVPYITLPQKVSDKVYIYRIGISRLDKISQEYYGSPTFGWLIMMANPQYGALEINIPDQTILNVPYPLQASLLDYNSAINNYFNLYGY